LVDQKGRVGPQRLFRIQAGRDVAAHPNGCGDKALGRQIDLKGDIV
ncbi:hypothetical protein D030_1553B, partial [Vibrio parahaemolyticus AQ3810]